MDKAIINDLIKAREYSRAGKYTDSIQIFDKYYSENPETLNQAHKDEYALAVYNKYVKNHPDNDDFLKACEFITELSTQKDTTNDEYCIYTVTLFNVLRYLNKNHEYHRFLHWLCKLDPSLLGEQRFRKNDRTYSSNRDSYYEYLSKAYFDMRKYEKCIEVSKEALKEVNIFTNDSDTWHRWRITKSLWELNRLAEALECLEKVLEVKKEWYIYRLGAEIYYELNKPFKALDYLCPAILSNESLKTKVNLYYLAYKILKVFNPKMALPHAQLYYIIKKESGAYIENEILELIPDDSELDKKELIRWMNKTWTQYKFKNQKKQNGVIIKYDSDKNYGFIDSDGKHIFFHKNDFKGSDIFIGQIVSFYTEESFDKSKNRKSIKAVNIQGE